MKASWIFTTNDVIANFGVIVGGILVRLSGSAVPDLVASAIIGLVVFTDALRILLISAESCPYV
jgi:Co/Zn/Cd efflux system component